MPVNWTPPLSKSYFWPTVRLLSAFSEFPHFTPTRVCHYCDVYTYIKTLPAAQNRPLGKQGTNAWTVCWVLIVDFNNNFRFSSLLIQLLSAQHNGQLQTISNIHNNKAMNGCHCHPTQTVAVAHCTQSWCSLTRSSQTTEYPIRLK